MLYSSPCCVAFQRSFRKLRKTRHNVVPTQSTLKTERDFCWDIYDQVVRDNPLYVRMERILEFKVGPINWKPSDPSGSNLKRSAYR